MSEMATIAGGNDDPRKLRDVLGRATALASDHSLQSVMVGLAAPEAGLVFPQLIDFIESALRVEDVVFRMTRDRAVVFLADVDLARAKQILDRLLADRDHRTALAARVLAAARDCTWEASAAALERAWRLLLDGSAPAGRGT